MTLTEPEIGALLATLTRVGGLVVGLAVAVVQTATQLQETILTFVPKLAAALLVIALAGHWALDKLGKFTTAAFTAQTETRRDVDLTPQP